MKKLCMLTAAALALMLLAGCSAQEETEPLPASMDQETVLAAGEEILNQLLDGEYEAVYAGADRVRDPGGRDLRGH